MSFDIARWAELSRARRAMIDAAEELAAFERRHGCGRGISAERWSREMHEEYARLGKAAEQTHGDYHEHLNPTP